jgi:hypothetical protein
VTLVRHIARIRDDTYTRTINQSEYVEGSDNLEDLDVIYEGHIKMNLKDMKGEDVEWIHLVQDRAQ